jgi:predicted aspartyl protease
MGNNLRWIAVVAVAGVWPTAVEAGSVLKLEAREKGRLIAQVGVNGQKSCPFLLDTGTTTTVLDSRLAAKLGIQPTGVDQVHTFAGWFEFRWRTSRPSSSARGR